MKDKISEDLIFCHYEIKSCATLTYLNGRNLHPSWGPKKNEVYFLQILNATCPS